jgi:hypothetical protein
VNVAMRNAKSKYFHDKIFDCSIMNDPKKTWKIINSLMGKNDKSNNVNELLVNGRSISDSTTITNEFNDYFINIGAKLAAEYDNSCSNYSCSNDNQPINYNQLINFNGNQSSDTSLKCSPILVDNVISTKSLKNM